MNVKPALKNQKIYNHKTSREPNLPTAPLGVRVCITNTYHVSVYDPLPPVLKPVADCFKLKAVLVLSSCRHPIYYK